MLNVTKPSSKRATYDNVCSWFVCFWEGKSRVTELSLDNVYSRQPSLHSEAVKLLVTLCSIVVNIPPSQNTSPLCVLCWKYLESLTVLNDWVLVKERKGMVMEIPWWSIIIIMITASTKRGKCERSNNDFNYKKQSVVSIFWIDGNNSSFIIISSCLHRKKNFHFKKSGEICIRKKRDRNIKTLYIRPSVKFKTSCSVKTGNLTERSFKK